MPTSGDDIRIAIGYEHDQKSADQVADGAAKIATYFEYVDDAATTAANAVRYFAAGGTTPLVEPFQVLPNVVRNATQSLEELETQQRQNVVTTEQLNKSNDGIINGLFAYARANESAEQALARLRREQEQAGRALGESEADIEQALRRGGGSSASRSSGRGSVSRGGLDASSQILYATGNQEAGALVNVISDLGAAARSASPELLIITAALAGIGFLIQKFNEGLEEGREEMRRAAQQIKTYYDAVAAGTETTIRARRVELEAQLRSLEDQQTTIRESLTGYLRILQSNLVVSGDSPLAGIASGKAIEGNAVLEQIQRTIDETIGQLNALDGALNNATVRERSYVQAMLEVDQMTREEREAALENLRAEGQLLSDLLTELSDPQAITEVLAQTQELQRQIDFLSGIYYTSADAAAALAEQERELEEARNRQLEGYRRYIALELQLQDMDAAARKERAQAIRDEIRLAELYLSESVGIDDTTRDAVQADIDLLENELRRLGEVSDRTADALNRVTRAQNVNPTVGGRGDALSTYRDRLQDFTERVTDSADDLLEANKTLTDAQAELAEAQRDLSALDTGYRADQLAAAVEANTRLEEIDRDHEATVTEITRKGEAERQRILRQSNALISNAYAQRDALAAYLAIQNRNQQLDTQKDQETEALAQADAAAKEQRDAAAANYRDTLNDLQRSYDEQKTARDRAIAQAKADVTNAEYNLKYIRDRAAHDRYITDVNMMNQSQAAVAYGGAAIVQTWGLVARQSVEAINAAFSQNMANQRQALAAGAVGAASARGNTVTINVQGATTRMIDARSREAALRVMNNLFDQMGIRT